MSSVTFEITLNICRLDIGNNKYNDTFQQVRWAIDDLQTIIVKIYDIFQHCNFQYS